jgi:hypothetical protein
MSNFEQSPGWEREIPKYRASRALGPALKARWRAEPPFTTLGDNDCWQYGTQEIEAGEIISTTQWPHASFRPMNYSAEKVLAFFNGATKSRLPRAPWHEGRIRLDNGISDAPMMFDVRPPQIRPVDLRPIS